MDEGVIGSGAEPEVATATPGGGAAPGGAVPGGAVPGGAVPGGAAPGGAVPGGAVPGVGVPDGSGPAEGGGADRQPSGPAGPTGHPLVDAALAGLDRVAGAPAAEQVGAYEEMHRVLQQTLASIDQT
jgi:hypothetical protein